MFVIDPSNPSSYCVLDGNPNYSVLRIRLYCALGILEIASVFAVPLLMASVYGKFQSKMNPTDKTSKIPFFVWAFIILSLLLIVLMYLCNGAALNYTFIHGLFFEHAINSFKFLFAGLVVLPFADLLAAFIVMIRFNCLVQPANEEKPPFFGADWCHYCSQIHCITGKRYYYLTQNQRQEEARQVRNNQNMNHDQQQQEIQRINEVKGCCYFFITLVRILFHYFSVVIVTLFIQCALFNLVFIMLAIVAAPVETGSLFLYCTTSLFCLLVFFALVLNIFIKYWLELPGFDTPKWREQDTRRKKFKWCCEKLGPRICFFLFSFLLVLGLLTAGVISFVLFVSYYSIKVQEYRNNRGVLVFFGALLPSILAVSTGVFLQQLFNCLGNKNNAQAENNAPGGNSQVSD